MSFTNLEELICEATEEQTTIASLMINLEVKQTGLTEKQVVEKMKEQFKIMKDSVRKGTLESVQSRTGLTGGDGHRLFEYANKHQSFVEPETLLTAANALAVSEVNAAMGRIVATPTAGSAGILPAVMVQALDSGRFTYDQIIHSMFTASALGLVIANKASISGAAGGCQAEIGSATAMAAGALVELTGGTPTQVGHAVGIALKNSLGLVCDPVAGLVEIPCIYRNGLHAITAQAAADMALAGVRSIIPPDEVIQVMHEVGQEMPESLRETGIGGLAGTPTGQKLKEKVLGQSSKENGPAKYSSAYDIVGPIMVGPSSSHTAGAVRIGNIAYQLLNEKPKTVTFTLMGSFAKTYQGHGTDLALLAGVLGLTTMDDQIPEAKAVAKQNGLSYSFTTRVLGSYHPNTVLIELAGESRKVKLIASSIGGGKVEVQELDNYPLKFSGEQPTLVLRHQDSRGVIAELSSFLYEKGFNIARLLNERSSIGGSAITICEVDYLVDDSLLTELKAALPIIDELLLIKTD